MPGDPGATVVTTVCFLPMHTGCGCNGHPAFPTPSVLGGRFWQTSGAMCRGARRRVWNWLFGNETQMPTLHTWRSFAQQRLLTFAWPDAISTAPGTSGLLALNGIPLR